MQVVIGAGPAGLAAGWALRRAGHEVLVLEASDRVGGLAASIDVAGVRVDLGAGGLRPSLPPAVRSALEEEVALHERRRHERALVAGRWVPWPPTLAGIARAAPALAARVVADAGAAPLRRRRADRSWVETARAAAGPTLAGALHLPLAAKVWGTDPAELAGALHLPLAAKVSSSDPAELAGGLKLRTGLGRGAPTVLEPGPGAVVGALAAGLRVETGRRVTRLMEHADRIIVGLSDGRVVTAAHVHATLPAWQVAALLGVHDEPEAPPQRALVQVFLALPHPTYTSWDAHVLPDPRLLPVRVGRAADAGHVPSGPGVLRADVPCWPGDQVWEAGDGALGQRVADDLVRAGLPDPRPVAVHVERLPAVAPVPTRRSVGALGRAERALAGARRVTLIGRPGLEPAADLHAAVLAGIAAARSIGPGPTPTRSGHD